jgi:uncharacterized protein YbjT (DUF2867 family)
MGAGVVAVTGATGQIGRRVTERLAERDVALRLVVTDPMRAPEITGAEIAVVSDVVRGLAGHDPVTLEEHLERYPPPPRAWRPSPCTGR